MGGIPVALIYVTGQKLAGYPLDELINTSKPIPDDITFFCFKYFRYIIICISSQSEYSITRETVKLRS